MKIGLRLLFLVGLLTVSSLRGLASAQESFPAPSPALPNPNLNYPNSTSGLEHLAKDILKAQEKNDAVRASALLNSLVLPDFRNWYSKNFDGRAAANAEAAYESNLKTLPIQLAQVFIATHARNENRIEAVRFDKTCDDNAGDQTFGILESRLQDVPLYELRFFNGTSFTRLFAFVYADGAFRFLIPPNLEKTPPYTPHSGTGTKNEEDNSSESVERVMRGGKVQAALLIHRVIPEYPSVARAEHLQGTVRIHAIIGKDGGIRSLRVMRGACSLAKAAVDAVKEWRYRPTMIQGNPVEVDTTIDVTFALNH